MIHNGWNVSKKSFLHYIRWDFSWKKSVRPCLFESSCRTFPNSNFSATLIFESLDLEEVEKAKCNALLTKLDFLDFKEKLYNEEFIKISDTFMKQIAEIEKNFSTVDTVLRYVRNSKKLHTMWTFWGPEWTLKIFWENDPILSRKWAFRLCKKYSFIFARYVEIERWNYWIKILLIIFTIRRSEMFCSRDCTTC